MEFGLVRGFECGGVYMIGAGVSPECVLLRVKVGGWPDVWGEVEVVGEVESVGGSGTWVYNTRKEDVPRTKEEQRSGTRGNVVVV